MTAIGEYGDLARGIGAFKDIELDILDETLRAWSERPGDPHTLLEIRDGRTLAGFAVLCRASNTEFTFDVRAFCVDLPYLGKGVAERLVSMLEEEVLRIGPAGILRLETSSRKEAAIGKGVMEAAGYALIGHIAGFYGGEDDFYMYAKHLRRPAVGDPPSAAAGAAPAAAGAPDGRGEAAAC
jgi:GNAT superfamily N-acetyltransferase